MRSEFKKLSFESKFSRKFACWCSNHKGVSKLKKANRQEARNKLKQKLQDDLNSFDTE